MDHIARGIATAAGIRVAAVDVTETARELARRHGAGPLAAAALAEALAAVALLTTHLKEDDQALSFQLRGDGPLRGVVTEVWGSGALRGYPHVKRVSAEEEEAAEGGGGVAAGPHGTLTVIHSSLERVIYSGTVAVHPVDARTALATYFNHSLQTPAAIAIHRDGAATIRGLSAEKMPDGDTEAFVAVLERFADGRAREALARSAALDVLGPAIALPALRLLDERPLRLGCRCSEEKVLEAIAALPGEELRQMIRDAETQEVVCHFCAHRYEIGPELMALLLRERDTER